MHPALLTLLERRLPAAAVAQILDSAIPFLPYRLAPAVADLPLTASRVGGIGYWPQHLPLPVNAHGQPLALLAQINLGELPAGAAAAIGLPEHGLLAFYIDGYDDTFGMNDADLRNHRGYRCAYFADTTAPAYSRDYWRAQNPAAYQDDGDGTADDDTDDEDYWAENWQEDPQTCLNGWLQAVGLLVSALNDPALNAAWDTESTALYNNSSAWLAAHRDFTDRAACHAALRAACPRTHARITALDDARATQWTDDALLADMDAAFAARWQHDPLAEITAWLTRRDKLVAYIDDAALSHLWQQEREALRGFEGGCAHRYHRRLRMDSLTDLGAALVQDHFSGSEARVRDIIGSAAATNRISRASCWDDLDAMPAAYYPRQYAELNRVLGYLHSHAVDNAPAAQNLWRQYWRHDPQGVLTVDWAMQDELIAHYHNPALSAIWQEEWRAMRDNAAAIIAAAQEEQVHDASELDAILETHIPRTLAALRTSFRAADPATQAHRSALEQTMLASRMERLAAHFATLGFHADPDAQPAPDHAAIDLFAAAFGEQLGDDPAAQAAIRRYISGDESDPLQTALNLLAQTLHDSESPEETAAERETTQQYRDLYIADNDRYVASLHDDEYSRLWAEDRAALLAADITNRAQLTLLLNFSLQQGSNAHHLAHYHEANPVLLAVMRALNNVPADVADRTWHFPIHGGEYAADRTWYFPVHGEYAMIFRPPAEHYLLDDSADFAAHYGMSRDDWAAAHGIDPDDDEWHAAISRAQDGNHLGGYPFFTQRDPRLDDPTLTDSVLLFQLDSSEEGNCVNVVWGDNGVGAFFIDRADLAARRFDKAWFYWDCY